MRLHLCTAALWQIRIEIAEITGDLGPDRLDRQDGAERDDPDQQPVLDQILTGFLFDESNC